MNRLTARTVRLLALLFAGMIATTPALAEKPSWAGKPGKQEQGKNQPAEPRAQEETGSLSVSVHFGDRQRTLVRDYYTAQFGKGYCPRGLAKKQNGCMPPGQAKKWAIGQPLPGDVTVYNLPSRLVVKLGTPPEGHRYVRVASDILLIAIGTSMVVDAIEDLGRM